MTLAEARAWRDEIRGTDAAATVPTGYGPDKYFVQVWTREHPQGERLTTANECIAFIARVVQHRTDHERLVAALTAPRDTRSPIERMIDKACGLG